MTNSSERANGAVNPFLDVDYLLGKWVDLQMKGGKQLFDPQIVKAVRAGIELAVDAATPSPQRPEAGDRAGAQLADKIENNADFHGEFGQLSDTEFGLILRGLRALSPIETRAPAADLNSGAPQPRVEAGATHATQPVSLHKHSLPAPAADAVRAKVVEDLERLHRILKTAESKGVPLAVWLSDVQAAEAALAALAAPPDARAGEANVMARRLYDFDREHLRHHRSGNRIMPNWDEALEESRELYRRRAALFVSPPVGRGQEGVVAWRYRYSFRTPPDQISMCEWAYVSAPIAVGHPLRDQPLFEQQPLYAAPTPAARGLDSETIEACAKILDKRAAECRDFSQRDDLLEQTRFGCCAIAAELSERASAIRHLAADGGVQSGDTGAVRSPSLSAGEEVK